MNIEWLKNKAKEKFYPITHSKAVLYDDSNKTLYDELQTQKADYIKNLSANGKTITYTKGDGVTGNFDIQVTAGDGNYIPLSGTETDKPVTGVIEFKPQQSTRAAGGGGASSFTLGGDDIYGNVIGCFDFTNSKINFNGEMLQFVSDTKQILSLGRTGLSIIDNDDETKSYDMDFSTGKSGRITFSHSDGGGLETGSVELDGIDTITMKYAETGGQPTIKATNASTITLTSEDSNVSNDLTLTGLALPVNDKDAVNKQYVDNNYLPLSGTTSEHPMTGSISQSQTENDLTCYAPLQMSMQETKDGNKRRTILTPYTYTTIVESIDETIAGQMQIEFSPQKNKHMIEISGSSDCIIRGIGEPNEYNDVANKSYVDSKNKITSLTLIADNWVGDTAPYTQTVSVEGITANDNPILVSMLAAGTNPDMQKEYNKAFGIISSGAGLTEDGSVTFCVYSKPTMDITIGLKGA